MGGQYLAGQSGKLMRSAFVCVCVCVQVNSHEVEREQAVMRKSSCNFIHPNSILSLWMCKYPRVFLIHYAVVLTVVLLQTLAAPRSALDKSSGDICFSKRFPVHPVCGLCE